MEALVDERMAKAIGMVILLYQIRHLFSYGMTGVSNFNILKLKHLLANARLRPAFVQVELHP